MRLAVRINGHAEAICAEVLERRRGALRALEPGSAEAVERAALAIARALATGLADFAAHEPPLADALASIYLRPDAAA